MEKHEKLKHLTDQQVNELMKRYYDNNERVADLIEEFGINISPSNLYHLFPPEMQEEQCPYCSVPLIKKRESRSSYSYSTQYAQCPKCKHQDTPYCSCQACCNRLQKIKEEQEREKREQIYSVYDLSKVSPISFESLSMREKVYLSALVRAGLDEELTKIRPIKEYAQLLSPTKDMNLEIFHSLKAHAIRVHPDSPISAFEEGDDFPNTYYIFDVYYHLNIVQDKDKMTTIQSILYLDPVDYLLNPNETLAIWRSIALEECKQYLLHSMNKVDFPFKIGKKTTAMLEELLNHFSTAQIFNIISNRIAYALKDWKEKGLPKQQAANSVVGRCQKYGERALTLGWKVGLFRRDYELPQTAVSEVFFNRALGIGEKGFELPPSLYVIHQQLLNYIIHLLDGMNEEKIQSLVSKLEYFYDTDYEEYQELMDQLINVDREKFLQIQNRLQKYFR
jgi:hypothetical protein